MISRTLAAFALVLAVGSAHAGFDDFCPGDCDGDGSIAVNELLIAVDVALGTQQLTVCREADLNGDRRVTIDEVIALILTASSAC
jgi:hypothetical protein